jgi:quinol monooxygenase YgiN
MGDEVPWMFEARAKPGKRAALEEAIADLVELSGGEPGTPAYEWSIGEDGAAASRERYVDSNAALDHLRGFEENSLERMLTLIEPGRTTVWGKAGDDLWVELGEDAGFQAVIGGFVR